MIRERDIVLAVKPTPEYRKWVEAVVRGHWRNATVARKDDEEFYFRNHTAEKDWSRQERTADGGSMLHIIYGEGSITLVVETSSRRAPSSSKIDSTLSVASDIAKEIEEDFKRQERDRLLKERRHFVTPGCCEAMRRTRAIVICADIRGEKPPVWELRLASATERGVEYRDPSLYEERFAWERSAKKPYRPFVPAPSACPFCSVQLPKIVKKKQPPSPLQLCTDKYEEYCATCGEDGFDCVCWSPEAAFEPKASR